MKARVAAIRSRAFGESAASKGVVELLNVVNYRGFVFARLAPNGPSFEAYFGDSLTSIDNMVDRSPEGRLEVTGGVLRYLHDCNWKMFIENLNDTMHPMVAHESAAGTAKKLWAGKPEDEPKPMAIEQFLPFVIQALANYTPDGSNPLAGINGNDSTTAYNRIIVAFNNAAMKSGVTGI